MRVLLLFTYGVSLKMWDDLGIISREISLYKKLSERNINFKFLTYGNNIDLKYKDLLNGIEVLPLHNLIKSKNLISRLFKSVLIPLKLRNVFKNIDIIKTNQVEGSWIGIIAKILFRKKLIMFETFF